MGALGKMGWYCLVLHRTSPFFMGFAGLFAAIVNAPKAGGSRMFTIAAPGN
jgi:hypothetical protein